MRNDKILDVKEGIKWIGILDPTLTVFDVVMETKYGTTYNSYFIDADKKTIIETAKETYRDDYIEKIKKVVDPEEIEYIILNHTEPDHASNLKYLLELAPNATIVSTVPGIRFLKDMLNSEFKHIVVKDGDTLDLGNKTLRFISAPFLHWPDSMYTFLEEDKILFTCDSFGCHYCDERIFDDLVGDFDDAFRYYFNVILKPYSSYMLKAIDKIKDLDIDIICPGHGPVLRDNWRKYVELSKTLAEEAISLKPQRPMALVAYVSAYGNTGKIAKYIAEGIKEAGDVDVEVVDIESIDLSDLEEKVEKSEGILIGSTTINQNTLLPVYKMFSVINPVTNRGKPGGAFGSYGWSGEAVGIIENVLKSLKLKVDMDGFKEVFVPKEETKDKCIDFGKKFGEKILENSLKKK